MSLVEKFINIIKTRPGTSKEGWKTNTFSQDRTENPQWGLEEIGSKKHPRKCILTRWFGKWPPPYAIRCPMAYVSDKFPPLLIIHIIRTIDPQDPRSGQPVKNEQDVWKDHSKDCSTIDPERGYLVEIIHQLSSIAIGDYSKILHLAHMKNRLDD